MRPFTIEGTAPMSTTKYTVASVRPNQRMAAGTHATDGSTCRPEMMGPTARRSGFTSASSRPRGVPMIDGDEEPDHAAFEAREHGELQAARLPARAPSR